jgi:hypothetical protein
MFVVTFLLFTALVFWIIFLNGADVVQGWKSFFLFGWFEATFTVSELKFSFGIAWLVSFGFFLYQLFFASSPQG